MFWDIMNVLGIIFILGFLFTFVTFLIDFIFTKEIKKLKIILSIIFLFIGSMSILIAQTNGVYIKENSKLYSDSNNAVPLSITLVANSEIKYYYDKNCLTKGIHNGKVFFKINNLKINKFTTLKVRQNYRDNFLVPTVREDVFEIIRR
ncbi:hypothetical protein [Apilactobacillus ozensis]|uniref:hypothetical protein n=1 Tax=Apilactobacillus ozensis TaxID=866801 RepID=UPI00200B14C6|nr:hypothetical protein [Apilactobacillus ozensis]MCK8607127.1 hypothetical protein [Apilactobacillus ozensis]